MAYIDTTDPIARMNAAKDARRHAGLGSVCKVPHHAPIDRGEVRERKDLFRALALIGEWTHRDIVTTAHFCRLDNDELREFIESQFDVIAEATE